MNFYDIVLLSSVTDAADFGGVCTSKPPFSISFPDGAMHPVFLHELLKIVTRLNFGSSRLRLNDHSSGCTAVAQI
jgi:hypothetical protein